MPGLGRGLALLLLLLAAPAPTAAVKVWGLCPGRTGTDSLKQAFVEMGLGPAYHMKEILIEEAGVSTAGHVEAWHKAANGVPVDLVKLLKDFNSGCDFPLSAFPEELIAAFPDAKFVLTTHPADKRFTSINTTVCAAQSSALPLSILKHIPFGPFPRLKLLGPMVDAMIKNKFAPGIANSVAEVCQRPELAKEALEKWNAKIVRIIPPSQLLIFELGVTTYAELAAFIGVPEPTTPYPHVNSTAEMQLMMKVAWCVALALVIGIPATTLWVVLSLLEAVKNKGKGYNMDLERAKDKAERVKLPTNKNPELHVD